MGKLHEILAVLEEKKNKFNQIFDESINTLCNKKHKFEGLTKIYKPFVDGDKDLIPDEIKNIATTVKEKIDYTNNILFELINIELQKNESNTKAYSNIEIDGKNFGVFNICSLMDLDKRLTLLRNLYKSIPTLDDSRNWMIDETKSNVYKSDTAISYRTLEKPKVFSLAKATKEHKEQAQLINIAEKVGLYKTTYFSGTLTSKDKSILLDRIDKLIVAIKVAKSKANQKEIEETKNVNNILEYINKDIL